MNTIYKAVLVIVLCTLSFAQEKGSTIKSSEGFKELTLNNIHFFIDEYGVNFRTWGHAGWMIDSVYMGGIYDQGMWLTGKINGSVKSCIREWWYEYSRGPIIDGKPAMISNPEDSSKYRVFKITKNDDDTNPDYAEWPAELGAPVDSNGDPKLYGDQMLWTVYNMFDTSTVPTIEYYIENGADKLNYILPVEVKEKVYVHKSITESDNDLLSNIVFIEYEFVNKGNTQIDSTYWGFWTDIDFRFDSDNNPLIDIPRQLGLCYSFRDYTDPPYINTKPAPAFGYTLLYGPVVDAPGSKAIFKGKEVDNKKNLELNTFHPINDDSFYMPDDPPSDTSEYYEHFQWLNIMGPPYTYNQAWNVARGNGAFNWPYYDPFNEEYTNFPLSGDPVTQTGWYSTDNDTVRGTGSGAGFVFFSGPFTLAPADTQWAMVALVPAEGSDHFDSITKLRNKVDQLRALPYDSLAISNRIVSSVDDKEELKLNFSLQQNYPNPFNPSTKIEYQVAEAGIVSLKIYDILGREMKTLVNEFKSPGKYSVGFNAKNGFSSGIYFYRLESGSFSTVRKMLLLK